MAHSNQTDTRQDRFTQHFPRLFAYVYGMTGDEETAREATIASFDTVLDGSLLEEGEFRKALYTAARKLTRKQRRMAGDGLDEAEREVISLLFDAEMTRVEVAELLGVNAESVLKTAVGGLKKLRAANTAAAPQRLQTLSA